ncbi:Hypothetical predicted protein [Mytilus galloprovincialis]|uniref:Uncharacterized protein n=1 Tax=Mytilus galloprovincialis TaxID=29158 RepID=A0A8B6CQA9_MYTGA|nr:Hypothetical predicted protein [Mytilus galloprovincialis]
MGKTVRMSQRPSKSPYKCSQRVQQRNVPTPLRNRSSNVVGQHTSTQVLATCLMTPELGNEVVQIVNALIHSPATVSVTSPDSVNERATIEYRHRAIKFSNCRYNGQLIIQTKLSKKITDINTWIDAFLIYISIYVGVHLEDTQNILTCMYSVKFDASRSTLGQVRRTIINSFV